MQISHLDRLNLSPTAAQENRTDHHGTLHGPARCHLSDDDKVLAIDLVLPVTLIELGQKEMQRLHDLHHQYSSWPDQSGIFLSGLARADRLNRSPAYDRATSGDTWTSRGHDHTSSATFNSKNGRFPTSTTFRGWPIWISTLCNIRWSAFTHSEPQKCQKTSSKGKTTMGLGSLVVAPGTVKQVLTMSGSRRSRVHQACHSLSDQAEPDTLPNQIIHSRRTYKSSSPVRADCRTA